MNTDKNDSVRRKQILEASLALLEGGARLDQEPTQGWVEALFSRVPTDILATLPAPVLVQVVARSIAAIKKVAALPSSSFHTDCDPEHGVLVSVVSDRPFIVNTTLELCRHCSLSPLSILHPVITVDGRPLAVTVVIAPVQQANELKAVEARLKIALHELVLATDDYEAMRQTIRSAAQQATAAGALTPEAAALLEWLEQDGFNLFGVSIVELKKTAPTVLKELGILSKRSTSGNALMSEFVELLRHGGSERGPVNCFSSHLVSHFHRIKPLTGLVVQLGGQHVLCIAGLFTSRALNQECQSIPLLRERFSAVVEMQQIAGNTHDIKSVADIIDSLPKEEAFSLSVSQLSNIVGTVIDIGTSRETAVSVWHNESARLISIAAFQFAEVYQPRTREEFYTHLEKRFGGVPFIDELHLDIANRPMVRLYARIAVSEGSLDLGSLQHELESLARSWRGDVEIELRKVNTPHAEELLARYDGAFSSEYQSLQNAHDCVLDMHAIESLSPNHPVAVSLANFDPTEPHKATIVISSDSQEITISQCVPALESFGFEVVNERSWKITPVGRALVHSTRFRVRTKTKNSINPANFATNVATACARALTGQADIDPLNSLHTDVALHGRAVATLRAYCRLLWQGSKSSSRIAVMRALSATPHLTAKLWQLFELKFNPALTHTTEERLKAFATESQALIDALRTVGDINVDRAFRQIRTLIDATVRTNLYRGSDAIALKIDSSRVDFFPQPRPYFEMFVSSPIVEGIHLRAGPVARGGIRWSDRPDDFRTEVLGLMKTQRVKNSLIVPTGAKGGFVPKHLPSDPKAVGEAVLAAYKEYIRALLSVTDNRVNGEVVHPEQVVRYDKPDPYFVVAADKGTATFSDTANRIAVEEFNFWLGDAFASGGSNGYDHKLYAITAKGAWECVKRHFRDEGTHADAAPFTAIGIGDMAGDVFGNGLLLSKQYKLVAAFNHKHIFLDPNPNPAASFDERKRLFELKGSQWSDYNPALISKGGAVLSRFEKEIRVSPEVAQALGLSPEQAHQSMTGDELINAILKAPVDVLWNGGIGTYVKASYQAHADAGDSANDTVRVSATELRARIIGEGGNLGFTQAARIEFNRLGGKLNTDAIDNSGGVDLSDHEVNLKILFAGLMQSGKMTREDRNRLLKEMSSEVCELVLDHNRSQALFLSLGERRSARNMPYIARLLRELTKLGYVNRALDNLPEEDALRERERGGQGLTRPELAVCLSTTKMWVKDVLLQSDLLDSSLVDEFCLEYFPQAVVTRYRADALSHPLRRNIVATQIANTLVDTLGVTSLLKLASRSGRAFSDAVQAATIAELVLNSRATRTRLLRDEAALTGEEFLRVQQSISTALGQLTLWFLSRKSALSAAAISVAELKTLRDHLEQAVTGKLGWLPERSTSEIKQRADALKQAKVAEHDALLIALCPHLVSITEVSWITGHAKSTDIGGVSKLYFSLLDITGMEHLLKAISSFRPADGWEAELVPGLASDLRLSLAGCVVRHLKSKAPLDAAKYAQIARSIDETLRGSSIKAATLAVFARQLATAMERD